ncbi:MAG TPA: MaoC family dehydratase N-terminal domain-containing protein [Candidatus Dormibacteraeota bacterium]|nr:MaoC family dehydratase N-terminal domain-containing protein [Candidatus Dormibacteraeota bacterium]
MTITERFPRITDETLGALRRRIGQVVPRPQPYIETASEDAIRHWTMGIGDRNPLFLDRAYGEASVHGTLLAPPTILYAMDRIVSGYVGGLPGVHAMFAGTDWHFKRPIKLDDRIRGEAKLKELVEREGRFAGRAVQQIYEVRFRDQQGEEVAWADSWCFRTERDTARQRGKYKSDAVAQVSPAEIAQVEAEYEQERIRGREPRRFSSVKVGDTLDTIVRGPYTPTMAIAFVQGWGGLYVYAHAYAFDLFHRHPATAIRNNQGVPEPPERVHWDNDMARAAGVPAAYDYGPERVSWMGTVATNWMGDTGALRRLYVEVRRHNLSGDIVRLGGKVVETTPLPGGGGVVRCDLQAHTQRGELSASGFAEVELPA